MLSLSIEPIGGGTKEGQDLDGDVVQREVPGILVDEIATDLGVGTVDDGEVWAGLLIRGIEA